MEKVIQLLENTEVQNILQENSELIESAYGDLGVWYTAMNNFILENIEEFLGETLEETAKNIYTFSTFGTKQFLCEVSQFYGKQIHQVEVLKEAAKHEFV